MDRIVTDPAIMGGVPCIAGTRIPVTTILGLLWEGAWPAEDLPAPAPSVRANATPEGSPT